MKNDEKLKNMTNEELVSLYQTLTVENPAKADEVIDYLYRTNRNLINLIARKYIRTYRNTLDFDDLAQIASIAFLNATKHFDTTQEHRFSTYLSTAIEYEIRKQLGYVGYTVRLPCPIMFDIIKVFRLDNEYSITTPDSKEREQKIANTAQIPVKKVRAIFNLRDTILNYESLNAPVLGTEDIEPIFAIEDESVNLEESIINNTLPQEIERLINACLTEREKQVIRYRFWDELTLADTGKRIHLSKERIRQIEKKSIRKLRQLAQLRQIDDYLYA